MAISEVSHITNAGWSSVRPECEHMFVPAAYPKRLQTAVRELLGTGLSDYRIAARTGVKRATVQRWRKQGFPQGRTAPAPKIDPGCWDPHRREAYSYLLGLYLGDGNISRHGNSFSLCITCDGKYPGLIRMCEECVGLFAPRPPAVYSVKGSNGKRVTSYWNAWPLFFPQHGPGSKLDRKIELVEWQVEIVNGHPKAFVRGLIHSDGSRCMNTFTVQLKNGPREYSYPRYFFTNYSTDIQQIFCDACDRLGIRWSRSNWRNISISHRKSVALLDEFIGPKT